MEYPSADGYNISNNKLIYLGHECSKWDADRKTYQRHWARKAAAKKKRAIRDKRKQIKKCYERLERLNNDLVILLTD